MIKEYTFNIEHKSTPVTLKYTEKEYEKLTQEEKVDNAFLDAVNDIYNRYKWGTIFATIRLILLGVVGILCGVLGKGLFNQILCAFFAIWAFCTLLWMCSASDEQFDKEHKLISYYRLTQKGQRLIRESKRKLQEQEKKIRDNKAKELVSIYDCLDDKKMGKDEKIEVISKILKENK